jgi:5,10-methylenetetrahydromethanopterin reductase
VEWGISVAREARTSAGLDPHSLPIGVSLNVLAHPDKGIATNLVRGMVQAMARYSVMDTPAQGPVAEAQAEGFTELREGMKAEHGGGGPGALPDEFVESYGVVGEPARCVEKLTALMQLGVTKFAVMPSNPMVPAHLDPNPDFRKANECMVAEVIPAVREAAAAAPSPHASH